MTITEERSAVETVSSAASPERTGIEATLGAGDHKSIGRLWIAASSLFLLVSLGLTLVAAAEASDFAGLRILEDNDEYVQVGSLARELLLFAGLIPLVVGLGIYLVPLQVGASSLAFARGAAGAFWTWLLGVGLLGASYISNGGAGGGRADFVKLWMLSLGMVVAAIIWALVTIATTVLGARAAGMTLSRVPATSWSLMIFSLVGILALPVTLAELVISYVRFSGGFIPLEDTDNLANVIRGVQAAPAIYWLAIPVLGILVDVVSSSSGAPVKAHRLVLGAIGLFGITSFGVDIVGFETLRGDSVSLGANYNNTLFVLVSVLAVLPVLAVLAILGPNLKPTGESRRSVSPVASLFSGGLLLAGVCVALLGVIEPIMAGLDELNGTSTSTLAVNQTTFVDGIVAAIVGSLLLALVAGLNHWSIKIWGRYLNQPFLSLATLAIFGGSIAWIIGNVGAGIDDQRAFPVTELTGGAQVEWFSLLSTAGILAVAAGVALFFIAITQTSASESEQKLRWTGFTLEWLTASPPVLGNFSVPPVVTSANPVADSLELDESSEE